MDLKFVLGQIRRMYADLYLGLLSFRWYFSDPREVAPGEQTVRCRLGASNAPYGNLPAGGGSGA